MEDKTININMPEETIVKNGGIKKFFFTDVFEPMTTQDEMMNNTCIPLLYDLLKYGNLIKMIEFKMNY